MNSPSPHWYEPPRDGACECCRGTVTCDCHDLCPACTGCREHGHDEHCLHQPLKVLYDLKACEMCGQLTGWRPMACGHVYCLGCEKYAFPCLACEERFAEREAPESPWPDAEEGGQ
jgi:hypothetical protein